MEGWKERCEEEKDFINDNYEKWKEEGRKEGHTRFCGHKIPEGLKCHKCYVAVITQYKEELLGKIEDLEDEIVAYIELSNDDGDRGRLQGVSEVKKLL